MFDGPLVMAMMMMMMLFDRYSQMYQKQIEKVKMERKGLNMLTAFYAGMGKGRGGKRVRKIRHRDRGQS